MGPEYLLAMLFGMAFIAACAAFGRRRNQRKNKE